MDYLIRFVQAHESFRRPELEALARLANVEIRIIYYSTTSPFCIVRFKGTGSRNLEVIARHFISNSILAKAIYELWGSGNDYEALHADIATRSKQLWPSYKSRTFKFTIDGYLGKRSSSEQRELINSFAYLSFQGDITMISPYATFTIFEDWETPDALHPDLAAETGKPRQVKQLYFGRLTGESSRDLILKHDLKKRPYISTTSMDAELALLTATLALASPGKLFFDPFVGTGGFMVAAAELEAMTLGSDIDGRSFRGKGRGLEKGVGANFAKYELEDYFGDCIISDLTNTPLRANTPTMSTRWLDGIICDPPYGVREGLKVLGTRAAPAGKEFFHDTARMTLDADGAYLIDGTPAHLLPSYIPPKRPYSFMRMLDDILAFAACTLIDDGRLAFWMPVANEGMEHDFPIPQNRSLELVHCCVQPFNRWSRRLLVYRRRKVREVDEMMGDDLEGKEGLTAEWELLVDRSSADDLNPFRKRYFQGFENRGQDNKNDENLFKS
jgi:tRNA (guanine10-N2)-methyltransferase